MNKKEKEKTFKFYELTPKGEILVRKKESELSYKEKDFLLGTMMEAWENNPYDNQRKFIQMFIDALQKPIKEKEHEVLGQYLEWLDVNDKQNNI